jgi:hypothetical protein
MQVMALCNHGNTTVAICYLIMMIYIYIGLWGCAASLTVHVSSERSVPLHSQREAAVLPSQFAQLLAAPHPPVSACLCLHARVVRL